MAVPEQAQAQQTCGGTYVVRGGDTLSGIADRLYRDAGKWTEIFRTNAARIGDRADAIRRGMALSLPCIDGLPVGLEGGRAVTAGSAVVPRIAAPTRPAARRDTSRAPGAAVRIVAADGLKPFSDRLHLSSGIISDVVNRAMVNAGPTGGHEFLWINDRTAHLDPILSRGMADLSYPWMKPDCAAEATASECTDYLYSEPMFETLVLLFRARNSGAAFAQVEDLAGQRLCYPQGMSLAGLNARTAKLVRENRVTLMQPARVEECFARLVRGQADFVAINEFTGRLKLAEMGLVDQVEMILSRPLSIETLHAVAHRANPRGEAIIAAFDEGLAKMQRSGEYQQVLETHLSSIWSGF